VACRFAAPGVLDALIEEMFDDSGPLATTYALVVVQGGRLCFERYAGALPHFDRPPEPVTAETPLLSWSMAKSMLHAVVGMLVDEGRLRPEEPAAVPEWAEPGDERQAITLEHLLAMRDGLHWNEDYVDDRVSDVIEMLFGKGDADMAHFAADRPLAVAPGSRFNYSSGTTNIISASSPARSGLVRPMSGSCPSGSSGRSHGLGARHVRRRRDLDRLLLCARDGQGLRPVRPALPARRHLRRRAPPLGRLGGRCPCGALGRRGDNSLYSLQWWVIDDGYGTFRAAGFEGQTIMLCPALDLIVVRCGKTPTSAAPSWSAGGPRSWPRWPPPAEPPRYQPVPAMTGAFIASWLMPPSLGAWPKG